MSSTTVRTRAASQPVFMSYKPREMERIAFTHDKSSYQAPCWRKGDPHPRITIERQDFLRDGQMRFFLAHEARQFVQLALSAMQGVKQIGGHRPTMPAGSVHPITDGILIDIDDPAGTPQRITFCQGPHRDGVIRFLRTHTEVCRAVAHRKRALTHGA